MLLIPATLSQCIREHFERHLPLEGCGLLVGRRSFCHPGREQPGREQPDREQPGRGHQSCGQQGFGYPGSEHRDCGPQLAEVQREEQRHAELWRPLPNTSAAPENGFEIHPEDFLREERAARARGLQVLAVAHSHPRGSTRASARDRLEGWAEYWMLIAARSRQGWTARCYRRHGLEWREERLQSALAASAHIDSGAPR